LTRPPPPGYLEIEPVEPLEAVAVDADGLDVFKDLKDVGMVCGVGSTAVRSAVS